jgi:phosphatidylinositol 4-kinase
MRLLQFLGSHFNATRLGSPHTEKAFLRLLNATLDGLKHSTGHPLAREIRFQIVLFGLKVLRHSIAINFSARCLLKDKILSAALSWFTFAPCWSFGGNRLQLKSETRLLSDVSTALRNVQMVGEKPMPFMKSLQAKESLLQALIESEQVRLNVWLHPLGDPGYSSNQARSFTEVSFQPLQSRRFTSDSFRVQS